jgi:chromosomal replication initiation ATPase DnaA
MDDAASQRAIIDDQARARLAAAMVSYAVGVPTHEILSKTRGAASASHARQLAMYLCHTAFEMSITRASIAFGRDRSTIAHACHRIEDLRDDPIIDRQLEAWEQLLSQTPQPGALRTAETP